MKVTLVIAVALVVLAVAVGGAIIIVSETGGGGTGVGVSENNQGPTQSRSINVAGSTTVLPVAQMCAERWMETHPNDTISVSGGGSGVGIASLIEGRCDIANASRAVKSSENEQAGGRIVEHKIALDAIAVVVHPDNPVNELTTEQIKKIYLGEITNWSQVGGSNIPIAVYTRESTSGTYETFHELVMRKENITPNALTTTSNGEMRQNVSTNPNAIGYVGIGYISGVKALRINGVSPSSQTVQNGTYPIRRYLYMYTLGEPTGLAKDFIDFVKGPEGQQIVQEKGFVPLS
ncbi:MAG: phosphate ABC transporter substrate-binding protein [Candidatus Hadarchaeales archaeon]